MGPSELTGEFPSGKLQPGLSQHFLSSHCFQMLPVLVILHFFLQDRVVKQFILLLRDLEEFSSLSTISTNGFSEDAQC